MNISPRSLVLFWLSMWHYELASFRILSFHLLKIILPTQHNKGTEVILQLYQ